MKMRYTWCADFEITDLSVRQVLKVGDRLSRRFVMQKPTPSNGSIVLPTYGVWLHRVEFNIYTRFLRSYRVNGPKIVPRTRVVDRRRENELLYRHNFDSVRVGH